MIDTANKLRQLQLKLAKLKARDQHITERVESCLIRVNGQMALEAPND